MYRLTRLFVLYCLIAIMVPGSLGAQPTKIPKRLPITLFTLPPQIRDAAISPSGRHLALLKLVNERYLLVIHDLDGPPGNPATVFDPGSLYGFSWIEWAAPDRLLISVPIAIGKGGRMQISSRLIAIGPQGQNPVQLIDPKGKSRSMLRGEVIDFLPYDPRHVLMSITVGNSNRPEVHKVNLHTGEAIRVQKALPPLSHWVSDSSGTVRLGSGIKNRNFIVMVRGKNIKKWRTLVSIPTTSERIFSPITFLDDPNIFLVESNHEGGPSAVYEYNIAKASFGHRVFGHDKVDISGVVLDHRRRLLGIEYLLDRTEIHYTDPTAAHNMAMIKKSLPDKQLSMVSASQDSNRSVIFAGSATDPGHYYVYDRYEGALKEFGSINPALEGSSLAPMIPMSYTARDGLKIPAYITLPRGVTLKDMPFLPTIILPHGGPWSRDRLTYDFKVQFLVNRGYAVMQMNFRGSSGYGLDFEEEGYRQWGRAMQDDITDGAYWLVNQGIADPNRICIYGASYGGYAALMGAIKTPDLFQCAVSFAGVTDLTAIAKQAKRSMGQAAVERLGDAREDRAELEEFSPVKRAKEIGVPVLLLHGNLDRSVPIAHSKQMVLALKMAGKEHKYVELTGTGHGLFSRRHRNRFLAELEMFFDEHLK